MPTVVVSPYSSEWPAAFALVREELLIAFAPNAVEIEHVGSTSVPGLVAKPVVDVLLGTTSLQEVESKIPVLAALGYEYIPKYERELPCRRYFVKPSLASLRVHLHAVERGSRFWSEHLAFRDALRLDASLRSRYQALKLRFATEFADDKASYQHAKAPFIQSVLSAVANRNVG